MGRLAHGSVGYGGPYLSGWPETPDDEVPPEVPTSFATKGVGWSGRDEDDLEVIELDK
jgi:hypothetical protein